MSITFIDTLVKVPFKNTYDHMWSQAQVLEP